MRTKCRRGRGQRDTDRRGRQELSVCDLLTRATPPFTRNADHFSFKSGLRAGQGNPALRPLAPRSQALSPWSDSSMVFLMPPAPPAFLIVSCGGYQFISTLHMLDRSFAHSYKIYAYVLSPATNRHAMGRGRGGVRGDYWSETIRAGTQLRSTPYGDLGPEVRAFSAMRECLGTLVAVGGSSAEWVRVERK